jgi:hypothetical protein
MEKLTMEQRGRASSLADEMSENDPDEYACEIIGLRDQLAAAQADNSRLREALEYIAKYDADPLFVCAARAAIAHGEKEKP